MASTCDVVVTDLNDESRRTLTSMTSQPGTFIVFEGGDGSGKTTQAHELRSALTQRGYDAMYTREPGGSDLGRSIRDLVLHSDGAITARAEALLFAADRAHHVATVIRPALERGLIVVCDRYVDSSLAYQCSGRGLSVDDVASISAWASCDLVPDLTIVCDVDEATAASRRDDRARPSDRMETDMSARHADIRSMFLLRASTAAQRYCVIDARNDVATVAKRVCDVVFPLLETKD